ncbi:ABC transporter permease [Actinomadura sp. SCN-SB]|uniref:ABC transporter permease n=1 Tax=Actinomadura sp. SCN-SB TaxID=3373092 RepID=UPI003752737E
MTIDQRTPATTHAAPDTSVATARTRAVLWRLVPIAVAFAAWWLLTTVAGAGSPLLTGFAPQHALPALVRGVLDGPLLPDAAASLWRLIAGLALAAAAGIPVGLSCGLLPSLERSTRPLFQFTRMISPLAWAPVAVALFGVGHQPVVFLVAMAAVWPVLLNTTAGVRGIDPAFLQVARSLGATRWEVMATVVLPAIRP